MTKELGQPGSNPFDLCYKFNAVDFLEPNPITVKGKTATVKAKKVKKKNQTIAASKVVTIVTDEHGIQGAWYSKVSGNKKITINKYTGTVTVKKKLKKGTYKVKIKVMPTGNDYYEAGNWQQITIKIKVK